MGTVTPRPHGTDALAPLPLIARERELGEISELLSRKDVRPAALVLEGEPGIGKTSLWETGRALGHQQGLRVLWTMASEAEAGLPFAAVIDLLDVVTDDELDPLPPPQLHALKVALYREDPIGSPADPQAISLGLLTALRVLAADGPLFVAIDDVQWLDRASDEALTYVVRRLGADQVTFLLARRPGRRTSLEDAFPRDRLRRVIVEPTSLGATRHILAARLGLRLPHHLLRRVYDTTLGNPLFALEVGRVLASQDPRSLGEDVPVPDHVEDLLGLRVTDLEAPVRRVLLALALDADLRVVQLRELSGPESLERAREEGVVVVEGERVRASHPLLAAAAKRHATADQRRDLHRALADVVANEQRRALHLALATPGEDDHLAERLAAAADLAAARGTPRLAVELGTHAVRLTPTGGPTYFARVLELGQHLAIAGEKLRLTELLGGRVESMPDPASRVAAYLLLIQGVVRDNDEIRQFLAKALAEAGDDRHLRAPVLAELAENDVAITVAQVARAEERAAEAVESLGQDRPDHLRRALAALAWTRALGGQPVDDLSERYQALPDDRFRVSRHPDRVAGQRLVWRGEVPEARELLTSLKMRAEERGEPSAYALIRLHLCELELRVGAWSEAQRLLDDWGASTDNALLHWPMYERCRALLAAGRGDSEEARRWGRMTLDRVESTGVRWDWLEAKRALGLAALLDKDIAEASQQFATVWDHTQREWVEDPGVFPVAPDLVEALVEGEATERARDVAARLAVLAQAQNHPWAQVGAQRSAALVELSGVPYDDAAADKLEAAAGIYRGLGLLFEEARTLFALGRAQRRGRKWGAARDTLERAVSAFDSMGSPGWATDARSELARVGARRPTSPGLLTATELRVAGLAVDGLSNKEIARNLVVTVNTVEFHLRNTYAKLGIRSRVQLATRLHEEGLDPRS
jgi:DNA-binding CsgD family transcriptional regulator